MMAPIRKPSASVEPTDGRLCSVIEDIEKKVLEEEALFEEAELYANMGLPTTSINICIEILMNHSSNPRAWLLLLSCYSSLGKKDEFNKAAEEFHQRYSNNRYWSAVQALGRTLDQSNPLYIANNGKNIESAKEATEISITKQTRSIGEILREKGILTDMILQHYLSNYKPEKHGRLGGFLLKNKAISISQLNHVLIAQQSAFA